jgi:hypothetical protein
VSAHEGHFLKNFYKSIRIADAISTQIAVRAAIQVSFFVVVWVHPGSTGILPRWGGLPSDGARSSAFLILHSLSKARNPTLPLQRKT